MRSVSANGRPLFLRAVTWQRIARLLAVTCLVALAVTGTVDVFVMVAGLICIATIDLAHPLCLKNYFLAYAMLIFGVGGLYFARGDLIISLDLLLYVSVFVASYSVVSRFAPSVRAKPVSTPGSAESAVANWLLWLVLAGWVFLLVAQVAAYGASGFYSGEALADRIARYGHADFVNGLVSVFEQGLSIVTLATAAYYIDVCVRREAQPNYWRLALIFLVMPIFLLRRADNAIGTLFLLAAQPVAARMRGARYSLPSAAPLIAGSVLLSLASSVVIGSLREVAVAPPTPSPVATERPTPVASATARPGASGPTAASSSPVATPSLTPTPVPSPLVTLERTDRMLRSELSPIAAYRDIREHPTDFGYRLGSTIIPPLVLKVAPRSWFPDKPISSSAYYMMQRDPGSLAAGYLLPVTIFGDALLNFGYAGALAAAGILGLVAGRLDRSMRLSAIGDLPAFLIIYYNFYTLLRNDLANSLAVILLTAVVFVALRQSHVLIHLVRRRSLSTGATPG
jgi:hypothetical protein